MAVNMSNCNGEIQVPISVMGCDAVQIGNMSIHNNIKHVNTLCLWFPIYEGRTESHKQLFFCMRTGNIADEGECGGRWNQLLCYP